MLRAIGIRIEALYWTQSNQAVSQMCGKLTGASVTTWFSGPTMPKTRLPISPSASVRAYPEAIGSSLWSLR